MAEMNKSRTQRAAERAEILENMTDVEKENYRKRKQYVGVQHAWKNFISTMSGDDVKELILAIISYDETGIMPTMKNPTNIAVFAGFIKSFLDSLLNEWYLTCFNAQAKGRAGGQAKFINMMMEEKYKEKFNQDNFQGIKIRDFIRDPQKSYEALKQKGGTRNNIDFIKSTLADIKKECETEYNSRSADDKE